MDDAPWRYAGRRASSCEGRTIDPSIDERAQSDRRTRVDFMGLDVHAVRFVLSSARAGTDFSRTVMIGRQSLHVDARTLRRLLEESGWIQTRKVGRVRICAIEEEPFTAVERWLSEQRAIWEGRTDRLQQFVETVRVEESPE